MKAIYNPLESPKEFVLPKDFEGFSPERIKQIREIRKNQTVRTDMCLVRDSEQLKSVLRYQLKKMGFTAELNKRGYGTHTHLARLTGIPLSTISTYFNHNRYIRNEAKGKYMPYISQTQLLILCLFAGVKLSLDIEIEPLKLIGK